MTADLDDFRADVKHGAQRMSPPTGAGPDRRRRRRIRPLPEGVVRRAAQRGLRRSALARASGAAEERAARKMSVAEQIVLYQELAAHDAPRLVLAFVGIHHAASTLLAAGTDAAAAQAPARDPRRRNLGAGLLRTRGGIRPGGLRTSARRVGDRYIVNGQKLWASGGRHADWCLLLARTDPEAPKRKGISYFLLDMTHPGYRCAADPQCGR